MEEFQQQLQMQLAARVPFPFPEAKPIVTEGPNIKLEPFTFPEHPPMDALNIKLEPSANEPPPPPPIVICPTEVDSINITLEKNQQCACKDCGKLFNSVWYLKQHAVKHSNDRPFRCSYCHKTYKFRSNLYQHKCPDRERNKGRGRISGISHLQANTRRLETNAILKTKLEAAMASDDIFTPATVSDTEDNDIPITFGLLIHRVDEPSPVSSVPFVPVQRSPSLTINSTSSEEEKEEEPKKEVNCVRIQQLSQEEIDSYLNENRNKLYTCRKCRLVFPTQASLLRHSGAHSREELFPYKCNNCRQCFECERDLRRHSLLHIGFGPWKCEHCMGHFRSSTTLRRHQDNNRCHLGDMQNEIMVSSNSPLDPFSFIPSEADLLFGSEESKKRPDSGIASSPDTENQYSPDRFRTSLVAFDMFAPKEKDDDEDSGFRSRLNSVTQTCSPGSSSNFSMEGGSPARKSSGSDRATPNNQYSLGGGLFPNGEGGTFTGHFDDSVPGSIQGQLSFAGFDSTPILNVSSPFDLVASDEISGDGEGLLCNSVLFHRYENSNSRFLCKENMLAVDRVAASSSFDSSFSSFLTAADSLSNRRWSNNSDKYDDAPINNNEQNEEYLDKQEDQIRFLLALIVLGEIAKAVCVECRFAFN